MTQPTTAASGLMAPAPDPATFPDLNHNHASIGLSNWDDAENRHWSFWNMDRVGLQLVEYGRGSVPVAPLHSAPRDLGGVRVNLFGREMTIGEWREAVTSHGFIVVRGDEILHEAYGNGMSMEDRHSIQSITKTTVCALIGSGPPRSSTPSEGWGAGGDGRDHACALALDRQLAGVPGRCPAVDHQRR